MDCGFVAFSCLCLIIENCRSIEYFAFTFEAAVLAVLHFSVDCVLSLQPFALCFAIHLQ